MEEYREAARRRIAALGPDYDVAHYAAVSPMFADGAFVDVTLWVPAAACQREPAVTPSPTAPSSDAAVRPSPTAPIPELETSR